MRIPIYQIDAFTSQRFTGNPAAVCPLEKWLGDETLLAIAAANNLAETAFFVPLDGGYHLRWFTPAVEVKLCGHATLATGHVILNRLQPNREASRASGLSARRRAMAGSTRRPRSSFRKLRSGIRGYADRLGGLDHW
jgi:PhzF family phenazine biosynthesis protein